MMFCKAIAVHYDRIEQWAASWMYVLQIENGERFMDIPMMFVQKAIGRVSYRFGVRHSKSLRYRR